MTFKEAKILANKPGGLVYKDVLPYNNYFVVSVAEKNESLGYACYVSKAAEKAIKAKYKEDLKQQKRLLNWRGQV